MRQIQKQYKLYKRLKIKQMNIYSDKFTEKIIIMRKRTMRSNKI